jgi:hypothetical protein
MGKYPSSPDIIGTKARYVNPIRISKMLAKGITRRRRSIP